MRSTADGIIVAPSAAPNSTAALRSPSLAVLAALASLPIPFAVLLGLALLYLPIYLQLAETLWTQDDYAHGPLIAAASAFLLWRRRTMLLALPAPRQTWPGVMIFVTGLMLAWLGKSQELPLLATVSQLPVIAGIILVLRGPAGLRVVAFPLLFLLFMVPLPGLVIDALTFQLKEWISASAAFLLHAAGYPVARSGVIVVIGQYQMLVADACSGLHSLFSLAALGVLYVHLRPQVSDAHKALMLAAIIPVALAANLLRTVALLLTTYHAGDLAARTWHDAAGILLFLFAIFLLATLDAVLGKLLATKRSP